MAYPNPYDTGKPPYSQDTFNPYEQPRFDSYDQGGPSHTRQDSTPYGVPYTDEPLPARQDEYYRNQSAGVYRQNTRFSQRSVARSDDQRSGFDHGEFNSRDPILAAAEKKQLWTRGSRSRCIGRFCGCFILVFLLFFLSIVGALLLWIRPPSVTIGDVVPEERDGSVVSLSAEGLAINLGINITVNNPNYFSVDLSKITAELFYPINDTPVGGGTATNVKFPSNTETVYDFPLKIDYKIADDPSSAILVDLAQKCGLLGSASNIDLKYKITVGIRIVLFTVSPVIENSVSLRCPLDPSDLEGLLGR